MAAGHWSGKESYQYQAVHLILSGSQAGSKTQWVGQTIIEGEDGNFEES